MGERTAGVVCQFSEQRLRFAFSQGSHFWGREDELMDGFGIFWWVLCFFMCVYSKYVSYIT